MWPELTLQESLLTGGLAFALGWLALGTIENAESPYSLLRYMLPMSEQFEQIRALTEESGLTDALRADVTRITLRIEQTWAVVEYGLSAGSVQTLQRIELERLIRYLIPASLVTFQLIPRRSKALRERACLELRSQLSLAEQLLEDIEDVVAQQAVCKLEAQTQYLNELKPKSISNAIP